MKASATVYGGFNAAHRVESHSACHRNHGHDWSVAVTVESSLRNDMVVDHGELWNALDAVCRELANEDLNDMLPGVVTTPEGIAAYLRERLILSFPTITAVRVRAGAFEAFLEWQIR